ncbi:hypothetical protein PYW08_015217 [Mythimna loreyi]|uniref:Uncharacterized protein n=1 Tax=Mythimna loreyi TaxID=667449 RepID=A0ACC2QXP1_9NEOP|nr:hypothetical protein PYW08_015217 [Mythimna loreyi]
MKLLAVLLVISAVLVVANAKITFKDLMQLYDMTQSSTESNTVATQALFIPMSLKQCTNDLCDEVCKFLGFHHGVCVSSNTCNCTY